MTRIRILQILLGVIGALYALGGLTLLFATSWVMSLLPTVEPVTAPALLLKTLGTGGLGLGYMSLVAARDPVRYAAVVDVLAGMLVLLTAVDLYTEFGLQYSSSHLAYAIWVRTALRLILAIILLVLRPRIKVEWRKV
jgi:hypothetical protein